MLCLPKPKPSIVFYGDIAGKRCCSCGDWKPLEGYNKNKRTFDGKDTQCRECSKLRYRQSRDDVLQRQRAHYLENRDNKLARNREWRIANRKRMSELMRDWRVKNPDKDRAINLRRSAREHSLPCTFAAQDYAEILSRFGGCALTGSPDFHWDHVIPLSTGHGGTTIQNMVPLRSDLNMSKGDSDFFEWFEANRQRFELREDRFVRLIQYLADMNSMDPQEYRDYVYRCHERREG